MRKDIESPNVLVLNFFDNSLLAKVLLINTSGYIIVEDNPVTDSSFTLIPNCEAKPPILDDELSDTGTSLALDSYSGFKRNLASR